MFCVSDQKQVIERLDQTCSACEAILQKLNEVSDLMKPRSIDEGGADKEEE